jgi:hypothetical protein
MRPMVAISMCPLSGLVEQGAAVIKETLEANPA